MNNYIPNAASYTQKGLFAVESLQIPSGDGPPDTAINAPDNTQSAFYFDRAAQKMYYFNTITQTWAEVGAGNGGSVTVILPAKQIAFGSTNNEVTSDANFTRENEVVYIRRPVDSATQPGLLLKSTTPATDGSPKKSPTPATDGSPKKSPTLVLGGNALRTGDSTSQPFDFGIEVRPVQGGVTTGNLAFMSRRSDGIWRDEVVFNAVGGYIDTQMVWATYALASNGMTSGAQLFGGGAAGTLQSYKLQTNGTNFSPKITAMGGAGAGNRQIYFDPVDNGIILSIRNDSQSAVDFIGVVGINYTNESTVTGAEKADMIFSTKPTNNIIQERMRITSTGHVVLSNVPNAANDAAAASAGVPVNGLYRNGSQLMIRTV